MGVEGLEGVSGIVAPIGERQPRGGDFDAELDEEQREDESKVEPPSRGATLLRRPAERARRARGNDDGKGLKVNVLA